MRYLSLLLFLMFSMDAKAIVFGNDDRHVVDPTRLPFNRVLRLDTGCTASLVGPSLLLTAAHCVSREIYEKIGKISYFQKNSLAVASGRDGEPLAYATKAFIGTFDADRFYDHDWALVKIDQALGEERGYFQIEDLLSKGGWGKNKLTLPGFPGDRPHDGLLAHIGCSVLLYLYGPLFRSDCDGWGGNSGAPFLVQRSRGDSQESEWIVVGVFIKALREYQSEVNPYQGNMGIASRQFLQKWEEAKAEL